jgi:hypothetical protein
MNLLGSTITKSTGASVGAALASTVGVESGVGVGLAVGSCSAEHPVKLRLTSTIAVISALLPIPKW